MEIVEGMAVVDEDDNRAVKLIIEQSPEKLRRCLMNV
jgi:hypothetical protein